MKRTSGRTKRASADRPRAKNGQFEAKKILVVAQEAGEETPLRPRQCRTYLRRELARSFRGIVQGFVTQAESGSVQHLKLTTELLEEPDSKGPHKGPAQVLLEKLRRVPVREGADVKAAPAMDVWRE